MRFDGMGRKWEGNYETFWDWREMGRKKIILFVGEGNWKGKKYKKMLQNYHKTGKRNEQMG